MTPASILESASNLLKGEAARAIGYGSALVIVGVVAVSNALGFTRFGENIDIATALVLTTGGIATLASIIESIRHFVYSQNTVNEIVDELQGNG